MTYGHFIDTIARGETCRFLDAGAKHQLIDLGARYEFRKAFNVLEAMLAEKLRQLPFMNAMSRARWIDFNGQQIEQINEVMAPMYDLIKQWRAM